MNKIQKFVNDFKETYGMSEKQVLDAIQTDSQHDFLVETQNVSIKEASDIISKTEEYLFNKLDNPYV